MKQPAQVILYSKPGCHLCEEMKAELGKANCADWYQLEEVNIESDQKLLTRYGFDTPVLTINGVEAFRHRLTAESFKEYLAQHIA